MKSLTDLAGDLSVSTEQVLTTLRIVATRAGVDEVAEWATRELEGYGKDDELPPHRSWVVSIVASLTHPGGGVLTNVDIPVSGIPKRWRDAATTHRCLSGIGQIESLFSKNGAEALGAEHPNLTAIINESGYLGPGVTCVQAAAKFSPTHVRGVVDRARQTALKLCLECEARGLMLQFVEADDPATSQERSAFLNVLQTEGTKVLVQAAWVAVRDFFTSSPTAS